MPASSPSALPPMRLGEIVLRTARYTDMTAWYRQLLAMAPSSEHVPASPSPATPTRMCFFRLHADHPYQEVIAIFEMPGLRREPTDGPGLHHMHLRNASMTVLGERYRRLRAAGIVPVHSMDHGPSTSLYYRDPDANLVEVAAGNFATFEETQACLASPEFQRNPAGVVIDPDAAFAT